MMSDETQDNGPSGWAWYQLGRMAAKADRSRSDAIASVFAARRQNQVVADPLLAQNQALAAENAQLRQELAEYQRNYSRLDEWARRAERQIAQLLKDRDE
jgi:crotonobetainyl-CoA:carnitine CoA-transferase CaiB-like acyl-CoA transferase